VARWLTSSDEGTSLDALSQAPCVIFDHKDDLQDRYLRSRGITPDTARPRHFVPSSEGFVEAVALGLGWGMVPDSQRQAQPERLLDLDPSHPILVPLYWQQWRLESPALAALRTAVQHAARQALSPVPE
jgi:LysR family transcriptional regulator (chromosome initiation inhibitor)